MSLYNDDSAFALRMDPSYILMCMKMWRDAVDMKIPLHDNFKVQFMAERRGLLDGFEKTAHAWEMLLGAGSMLASEADQVRLDELRAKVEEFKAWAKAGLAELDQVAAQEEMHDTLQEGLQQLAADPAGRAMLKRMIDEGIFKAPPGGNTKGKG